jgi:hypothetical protein
MNKQTNHLTNNLHERTNLHKQPNKRTYTNKQIIHPFIHLEKAIFVQLLKNLRANYGIRRLFFLICIAGGVIQGPLDTTAINGILCQPRVIMMMEKSVVWLAGETEVLGENLPQCRFVHHKPHMLPVREPGPPRWEASI